MLTAEQIAARTRYIGASDAPGVLGLSRWDTPLRVWAEKTGTLPLEQDENIAAEAGDALEPLVIRLFERKTGKKVERVSETLTHPNYEFIKANLDGVISAEDAVFEAKTASAYKADEWDGEDVPNEYVLQVQHQLAVTGKSHGYIAVLIGNHDFRWKRIDRDNGLIKEMIAREVDFWVRFVETNTPPRVVHRQDTDTLSALYPNGSELTEVALPADAEGIASSIKGLQKDADILLGAIEREKNKLRLALGDTAVGIAGKWRVTWKNQTTERLDLERLKAEAPEVYAKFLKATPSRVLRITEIKAPKEPKK